jgi:beta-1,4-mannosyltransferase
MNVVFGPDYRLANPYQANLATALEAKGVHVGFSNPHRRIFPLFRDLRAHHGRILHLHWPETFFRALNSRFPGLASVCPLAEGHYLADLFLSLSSSDTRMVLTAHNLWPHRRSNDRFAKMAIRATAQKARAIIAHSTAAASAVVKAWEVDPARIAVIPHGDLSAPFENLPAQKEARSALPVPETLPLFLIFGVIEAYKGIDEVVEAWQRLAPPARLAVVGHGAGPKLMNELRALAGDSPHIHLLMDKRLSEKELGLWLAAADGVVFNYRRSLTSGAACLARSLRIPVLIHHRANTIDLGEPHSSVFRYASLEDDFGQCVERVIRLEGRRPDMDPEWPALTAWPRIAAATLSVYQKVLSE